MRPSKILSDSAPGAIGSRGAGQGATVLARARTLSQATDDQGVSFLADHVELDVGHTHFNRRELGRFLASLPAAEDGLVAAGTGALESYGTFLDDCVALAEELSATRPVRAAEHAPVP